MPLELRPEVAAFAQLMEAKLRENDHKGGWHSCSTTYLSRRLGNELKELRVAVSAHNRSYMHHPLDFEAHDSTAVTVGLEAADVGNFAMMLADNVGGLLPPPSKETPGGTREGGERP